MGGFRHTGATILTSSGSQVKAKGVFAKQFKQMKYDKGNQLKASPLKNLDNDIKMIQNIQEYNITIIQSSKHKNNLKSIKQIKQTLRNQISGHTTLDLYFTGHGYQNGDMCIQTLENPEGEPLTIEQILSWKAEKWHKGMVLNIYIDACYSGNNAERAREYARKHQMINLNVYCSSSKYKTSFNLRIGGLLILKLFYEKFGAQRIDGDINQLKQLFQQRGPVCYERNHESLQKLTDMNWKIN